MATVGCGYFSRFHHEAWHRLDVDHVAVCDRDVVKAEEFSRRYGVAKVYDSFEDMIEHTRPDLVDLILPPAEHYRHVQQALEHGAHVICQKPFTTGIEEAAEVVDAAAARGCMVVVHENFRFQPWYRKIKQLMDENWFGQLYQVRFDLRPGDGQGNNAYLDRQPYFQHMPEFLVKETGVHFIDVFRFLCGEVLYVWSDLRRLNPVIEGEDAGIFVLGFDDNLRAVFDGNRLSDHAAENPRLTMGEMTIEGERGSLRLNGYGRLLWRAHGDKDETEIPFEWSNTGFGGDCVYNLQKHVLDHLRTGSGLENSAADYWWNLRVQHAVYTADKEGCRQVLPQTG